MADDFGLGSMTQSLTGGASTAVTVVNWIIIIGILGGLGYLIWFILQYKHQAKIKVWTNNGYYYVNDKAREVTKDGVTQWHLWNLRVHASTPPPGARSLSKKGKQVAEGYFTPDTGVVWATDKTTRELIEQKFSKMGDAKSTDPKEMEKDAELFTTTERAMMIDQIKRAMLRKRKNALEVIGQFAAPIALVIILLLVLIFWGDIAQPVQALQQSNAEISKQNAEISAQNAQMISFLTGQRGFVNISQTIPGNVPVAGAS